LEVALTIDEYIESLPDGVRSTVRDFVSLVYECGSEMPRPSETALLALRSLLVSINRLNGEGQIGYARVFAALGEIEPAFLIAERIAIRRVKMPEKPQKTPKKGQLDMWEALSD
jgi:hypothetical protein